jgi:hypothetical protein
MVVKAWDLGVATMCAGEKARFYCQSSYLDSNQSEANSVQSVELYSTFYDIELLSWQGLLDLFNDFQIMHFFFNCFSHFLYESLFLVLSVAFLNVAYLQ